MTATPFLRTAAGRFCPADYRYPVATFARMPDFEAETIYVVGGLYGNRLALDAVERMAEQENGKVEVVYNGDFHWFDTDPHGFAAVQSRVLACRALRGNVETEIAREDGEADVGCGCAYPDTIADAVVERSNTIFHMALLCKRGAGFPRAPRLGFPKIPGLIGNAAFGL